MKKHKQNKNRHRHLIRVSALAVLAAPVFATAARAQTALIKCAQNIDIGLLNDGGCAGSYVISPDGVHSAKGCLVVLSPAVVGICTVSVKSGPLPSSAVVSFVKTSYTLTGTGGGTLTLTSLRMREQGTGPTASKLTFSPTQLSNTVTINIGGTLNYVNGQTLGVYSGQLKVTVN